ncbi:hypothetical protein HQ587_05985 [bacterium]|nr:hypothetical protein [bacterium]
MQTFFIYTDNEKHPMPADVASIPLVRLDGNPDEIVAYGGAIWGEYDLTDRDYCIAWEVRPSSEFHTWLSEKGYQIKPEED